MNYIIEVLRNNKPQYEYHTKNTKRYSNTLEGLHKARRYHRETRFNNINEHSLLSQGLTNGDAISGKAIVKVIPVKGALTNGKLEDILKTEYPERYI